jgi:CheY-like chemotaxis protein
MILPAAMNAIALHEADAGSGRILVVEDDRTFGEALCQVLSRAGYATSLATDFQTALGILEAEQPLDLLLVDIVMPDGINGIALSRMARMRRRDLKVIYITGYNIPGVEREALGPVLQKPVDNQRLIEEIARVLAE